MFTVYKKLFKNIYIYISYGFCGKALCQLCVVGKLTDYNMCLEESHGKDDASHTHTPKVNGAGRGRPSSINKAATQAVLHDEKPLAGKPPKALMPPPPPPVAQVTFIII